MIGLTLSVLLTLVAVLWLLAFRLEKRRLASWQRVAGSNGWRFFEKDDELHWTLSNFLAGNPVHWAARPGCYLAFAGHSMVVFDLHFTVPYAHGHKSYRQTAVLIRDLQHGLPPLDVVPVGLSFRLRSKEEIDDARNGLPPVFRERYVLDAPDLEMAKAALPDTFYAAFSNSWREHCHCRTGGLLWFERGVVWPLNKIHGALENAVEIAEILNGKTK